MRSIELHRAEAETVNQDSLTCHRFASHSNDTEEEEEKAGVSIVASYLMTPVENAGVIEDGEQKRVRWMRRSLQYQGCPRATRVPTFPAAVRRVAAQMRRDRLNVFRGSRNISGNYGVIEKR